MGWALGSNFSLFPPALDLETLDQAQQQDLRTWFVAHVNIAPPRSSRPRSTPSSQQLSLLD
ncbi:MAG: hypothetical protein LVS60_06580 [Nodosilinea sp. LVE1205-7]